MPSELVSMILKPGATIRFQRFCKTFTTPPSKKEIIIDPIDFYPLEAAGGVNVARTNKNLN